MLKNEFEDVDLLEVFETVWPKAKQALGDELMDDVEVIADQSGLTTIDYPSNRYPAKIASFNLDKNPVVEGRLDAIKGQYLIFDNGVINLRKYGGYLVGLQDL